MTAIILAGGKGTRLKPFTMTIPKPLLPLGDTPVLEIVIAQLAAAGFRRIVLCLGHMAPFFGVVIGDGSKWGVRIETVLEEEPLGTAGALRLVKDPSEDFLVMNGDLLTTIDFADFTRFHKSHKALATIAVNRRNVFIDYGVVISDREDRLSKYREKPTIHYAVSMGIYMLSKKSLAFVPKQGRFDMPHLMSAVKEKKNSVFCYKTDCYWQDIGRFDDYQTASEDFTKDPGRFLPAARNA
jgi:NDP-sugar pyrophosphorylase family protein